MFILKKNLISEDVWLFSLYIFELYVKPTEFLAMLIEVPKCY